MKHENEVSEVNLYQMDMTSIQIFYTQHVVDRLLMESLKTGRI